MYRLEFHPRAQKELVRLTRKYQKKIQKKLIDIQEHPFSGKKLDGEYAGLWAIRVWPYRIIYSIDKKIVTVTVVKVGHRQGVYE